LHSESTPQLSHNFVPHLSNPQVTPEQSVAQQENPPEESFKQTSVDKGQEPAHLPPQPSELPQLLPKQLGIHFPNEELAGSSKQRPERQDLPSSHEPH
jgi:hypothetical protein